jgi:hypothetical protein
VLHDLFVVTEPPLRTEAHLVQDAEARDDEREKRKEDRRTHEEGDGRRDYVFLGEQASPPLWLGDGRSE